MITALKILNEETPKEFFKRHGMHGSPVYALPPGFTLLAAEDEDAPTDVEPGPSDRFNLYLDSPNRLIAEIATGRFVDEPNAEKWLWYYYDDDFSVIARGWCDTKNEAVKAALNAYNRDVE